MDMVLTPLTVRQGIGQRAIGSIVLNIVSVLRTGKSLVVLFGSRRNVGMELWVSPQDERVRKILVWNVDWMVSGKRSDPP